MNKCQNIHKIVKHPTNSPQIENIHNWWIAITLRIDQVLVKPLHLFDPQSRALWTGPSFLPNQISLIVSHNNWNYPIVHCINYHSVRCLHGGGGRRTGKHCASTSATDDEPRLIIGDLSRDGLKSSPYHKKG